jgi:hypothetical protein
VLKFGFTPSLENNGSRNKNSPEKVLKERLKKEVQWTVEVLATRDSVFSVLHRY